MRARARHLGTLFADVGPTSRALLLSQGGDAAGCAFTAIPSSPEHGGASCGIPRVLLLRKLQLPPQLARACGGLLDDLGDHRPACAQAGVLVRRAGPLERAAVRICKEARARMATNDVALRDRISMCQGAGAGSRSSPTVSVFGRAPKSRLMRRLLAQSDVTAVHARDPTARPASPLTRKHRMSWAIQLEAFVRTPGAQVSNFPPAQPWFIFANTRHARFFSSNRDL